jgi:hypothetical protein
LRELHDAVGTGEALTAADDEDLAVVRHQLGGAFEIAIVPSVWELPRDP